MTSPRFRERLSTRLELAQVTLTPEQADLLDRYWSLLERWNAKINLTALTLQDYPDRSIDRLIVEPIIAAALFPADSVDWYDLGSGGGSPAIPLKVLRPASGLTMVESRSRKAAFLREVLRSLGLADSACVENARFDAVAFNHPAAADYVTVRAVRVDEALLNATQRLLRPTGQLILLGPADSVHELSGFNLVNTVGIRSTSSVIRVAVPRGTKD